MTVHWLRLNLFGAAPIAWMFVAACSATLSLGAADWTFRNDVQPVLSKNGCNSGACHGAAAGQNGFRLSLRGYDDEGDYLALTRQAFGRRIVLSDPGRSLLLLKPSGAVPHRGGQRFDVDSLDYKILAEWIALGAPPPQANDPRIERLEIEPRQVVAAPEQTVQVTVRAHFSDGRAQDVTRWVKYTDANSAVTQVDEKGLVKVVGGGEGSITAWYLSRIALATISSPYTNSVGEDVFAQAPRRNFIDELVLEKLQALRIPPSARCSDATFIRRLYLDAMGLQPAPEEVRRFWEDADPGKRDR